MSVLRSCCIRFLMPAYLMRHRSCLAGSSISGNSTVSSTIVTFCLIGWRVWRLSRFCSRLELIYARPSAKLVIVAHRTAAKEAAQAERRRKRVEQRARDAAPCAWRPRR